jgi:hypothetical protein
MDVLRRARSFVALHPWAQGACVAAVTFVVYAITRQASNPYNQYVLLTDAFLHGRLYLVDPPGFLEIAKFGDRAFVIDPPAPTLFLLPFVALFGTGADHVLISCGVGAGAIGFLWVAARRLWTDVRFALAMTLLIALGTNFWWLASDGGFWSFAHTSGVFFLAAGLAEATGKRRPLLVGLCVGLAGLSRLPIFLIAPLYAYLVLDGDITIRKPNLMRLGQFGSALAACALLYVTYNVVRYGTISDLGYYHPQYVGEPWFERGRFDISYVGRHVRAIFYDLPVLRDSFPFVVPRFVGTALVITTPAFLYALRARLDRRNVVALLTLLLVAIPLVTHGATGFSQFGYRYAMDVFPCLLLLTASGMREKVSPLKIGVLAFCVLANLWGVLAFNFFDWPVS